MNESLRPRASDVEWRNAGNEVVILDLRTSRYLALNPTGSLLWNALHEETQTEDQLVAVLRQTFALDQQQAAKDVREFVKQLRQERLLED